MNKNQKVSIIIRTKNEERWIGHCIKRIHSQTYKNYEIILVDSLSTDNTVNKAKKNKIDLLIEIKEYKPGYAINEGIRSSSGELIVILSAHCLPINNNWLKDLVQAINSDEKLAGVYGKQVPMDFSSADDKRDLLIVFGEDERIQIKDSFFHNANSIIKKEVWSNINFDEKISNIEDRIWAQEVIKKGYILKYIPQAAVYHYHGIHQSGNIKRLAGVTKVIEDFKSKSSPGLISPNEFDICAVIPIRGEPLKFGNKNQLELASESIFSSKHINRFFVTTDSKVTLEIARNLGFEVLSLRDKKLANPETTIEEVQNWHLEQLETQLGYLPDVIVHAEVTFPYRPKNLLDDLIELFASTGADTVLPAKFEYTWAWKELEEDSLVRLDDGDIPREYKKSLLLASHGLGCVSHSEIVRNNSLVGNKLKLMPIENQLNFIEVRTNEQCSFYASKISIK